MVGNVIVGQSGGPTSVINSSLAGVYKTAKDLGAPKVYGMRHGIQGFLEKNIVDLDDKLRSEMDIELLKRTPSAYLGSCRFKLPEYDANPEMYDKIFAILEELEIAAFFYIGGNDSMDTINKLSKRAELIGSPIRFVGVPKTIDNDLDVTDHTPGFGSAAKYIASVSEGIKTEDGKYVFEQAAHNDYVDSFGHKQLSGTATYLANLCGQKFGCKARAVELATLQRCAGHMTSRVDITEAYQVGGTAVSAAFRGETGKMVI